MVRHWNRHNQADREAMAALLMPLVAASRSADFADVSSARIQVLAFLQALEDVPRQLVEIAIADRVAAGVTWMPKPGELKGDCAKLRARARREAARSHLEGCDHASHYVDVGGGTVERCPCWKLAHAAMDAIGAPVQAPLLMRSGDDGII